MMIGLFGWRRWLRTRARAAAGRRRGRAVRPRLEPLEDRLAPATLTWTGAVDNLWGSVQSSGNATLTNWTSSDNRAVAIPQAGDDLVFPDGAANLANSNDLSGLSVQSITFQGTGYAVNGNAVTLTGALSDPNAGGNALQTDLTLPNGLAVEVGDAGATLSLTGTVSGAGLLTKTGAGRLVLSGDNLYSGGTDVAAGEVTVVGNTSLGTGAVTVESGAALEIQANLKRNPFLAIANAITLNGNGVDGTGALRNLNGSNTLNGPITLASDSAVETDVGDLTLAGPVGGAFGLTEVGPQSFLTLSGSAPNTYAGPTVVDAGLLFLAKDDGVTAVPGDLVVGNGTGQPGSDGFTPTTVQLLANEQIADTAHVTVAPDGLLDLNGFSETVGSLAGTGQVNLSSGPADDPESTFGTLTVGANNAPSVFAGFITGDLGTVTKVGTASFTLAGASTYTGPTNVNGGLLLVDGLQPGSPVVVNAGGTLAGSGAVGPTAVNAGGTVAPDASPGPGPLTVLGGITFNPGSVLFEQLNGPTAGVGYGQLSVVGPVVLDGPSLRLALGFTPAAGQDFTLLLNNGSGPVQGGFAGAPEDALLRHGNAFFDLSYAGGRGSDVDLLTVTQADLFVRALFADFGATSDRATRAPFETRADGGESRLSVAHDFLTSPGRRWGEVNAFYAIFGQPADAMQAVYVAQLLAGMPAGLVLVNLVRSPAFRSVPRTNEVFVRDLFTGLLGHRPGRHDALGNHTMGFYVRQLNSGALSRARLVRELLSSDEVYTAAVEQNFMTFLGRMPTPQELQTLTGQLLTGGLTPDSLSESVVSLDDYVHYFLTRLANNRVPGVILVNV